MIMGDIDTLEAARREANGQQRRAADPAASAWVSANAGTGKTHVLVMRVLRLLLGGAGPASILCLTFTKAAAAEMSNRLIRELGRWAAKPEADLAGELASLLQRQPTAEEQAFARCLFALVLDAPGGLKILTIHAFCDRVLRRFPLEAGVPPSFTILSDEERRAALRGASDIVLKEAASEPRSELGKSLTTAVANAGEEKFDALLQAALGQWDGIARVIHRQFDGDPFAGLERRLRASLGVQPEDTPESLGEAMATAAGQSLLERAVGVLRAGRQSDIDLAEALAASRGLPQAGCIAAFGTAFLIKSGEPRADSRFVTKAIREAYPGLADELCAARDSFAALEVRRRALATATATAALLRLADAVLQQYEEAKARANALDFDALIAKTAALFSRSDAAAWVLYRLDADLTHILVDEAQDTSPAQWALIQALTGEFFSGQGAEDRQRTLFAVGDEKQSIYSFQGAEPRRFAEAGRDFAARAGASGEAWHEAPLTLSFRSTRAVLGAVDLVFADHARTPGLGVNGGAVRHTAHRDGEAGLVEIWPLVKAEAREQSPAWEPFAETAGAAPPAVQLANRIARQIRHWLDNGEMLVSQNRPVRAGDILILVRKRAPFAGPMVKALKDHGIPVAGADRLRLTEQPAVMDLMVLGDSLLLPEDDLALATLLKSPAFGFGDGDLFAIGHGRPGTLWDALVAAAEANAACRDAVAKMLRWREAAHARKPFEFYMELLEGEALRKSLIARLGPEAADAIDEFLNLALRHEAANAPSLQGFLHWLRISEPEIKRDMAQERDEVRVMTVHGAKGLEANVVFLADTASRGGQRAGLITLAPRPGPHGGPLPVWALPGSNLVPPVAEAQAAIAASEREEYHRLLYVAMTRARDRLYVAGFEGAQVRAKNCWYDLIEAGLGGRLAADADSFGSPVGRVTCPQTVPAREVAAHAPRTATEAAPDWMARPAPRETRPSHVSPSRLAASQPPRPAGTEAELSGRSNEEALLRGRLVHRLLELLPAMPSATWRQAGSRFLDVEAAALEAPRREVLLSDVMRILEMPRFGEVFGPASRAEVAVAAELPPRDGGSPVVISGQIDRLIVRESEIVAVDFKTGAFVPGRPELIPASFIGQMAAYRLVLTRLFPGRPVRVAILWTSAPRVMEIQPEALDEAEKHLYATSGSQHLDVA